MITIAYITARLDPRFDLFVDSISPQLKSTDQVVFIDHYLEYDRNREAQYKTLVDGRFDLLHIPPKPSIWRGRHRKSRRAFADSAGARNTAAIVAEHDYIVFIDDLSAVYPGWRSYHQNAAEKGWIFCGSCSSVRGLKVLPNGQIHYSKMWGRDGRPDHQPTDEPIQMYPSWVFGSNVGIPMKCLLKVNGYDELCGRMGGQDVQLGARLGNAGYSDIMYFDKNCLINEDQWYHHASANSPDLTVTAKEYPLRRWKTEHDHHLAASKELLQKHNQNLDEFVYSGKKQFLPLNPYFNLEKERELYQKTGTFRSVANDTYIDYDGQPIEDL